MTAIQETATQATQQIAKVMIVAGLVVALITTIQAVALMAWL